MKQKLIEIAKKWKGHEGVNFHETSESDLLELISDAVDHDRQIITQMLEDGVKEVGIDRQRLAALEKTLGTFISWSRPNNLGASGVNQLLEMLNPKLKESQPK